MTFQKEPAATPAEVVTPPVVTIAGREYSQAELELKITSQDAFIEKLKGENLETMDTADAALKQLEAIQGKMAEDDPMKALLAKLTTTPSAPPTAPAPTTPIEPAPIVPSTEELTESVLAALQREEIVVKQQSNMDIAITKAKAAYGDDFATKIAETGKTMDYSPADIDGLAKNHPAAFAKIFLPAAVATTPDTTAVSLTTGGMEAVAPVPVGKGWMNMSGKERSADVQRRMAALNAANK